MKLSTQTTEVLKNFSTINQNIMIRSGDTLKTVSAMKNIVATAKVPDNFVREVPIYNLKVSNYLRRWWFFKLQISLF